MKGDKTTVLALIVAAVILAVVGIKSFLDYKVAELEKIHGGSPAKAEATGTQGAPTEGDAMAAGEVPPDSAGLPMSGSISQVTGAEDEGEFPEGSIDRLPRSVLPPIPSELTAEPDPEPATAAASPAQDSRSRAEIDALRQETAMFQQKLDQLRSGAAADNGSIPPPPIPRSGTPSSGGSALDAVMEEAGSPGAGPDGGLPPAFGPVGDLRPDASPVSPAGVATEAVGEAPLTSQQKEAEVAALAEQVKRQPAIAKVLDYDPEWAILVLNGGAESNIAPQMRLAVRRGTEIVGFIKVTEVEPNQSIAELMSSNKFSPTARKPRPGDDVIAFNLF